MKLKVVLQSQCVTWPSLASARQIGIDAVPADASPALIAYLRIFASPMLGIAVLNWMARNAEPL